MKAYYALLFVTISVLLCGTALSTRPSLLDSSVWYLKEQKTFSTRYAGLAVAQVCHTLLFIFFFFK